MQKDFVLFGQDFVAWLQTFKRELQTMKRLGVSKALYGSLKRRSFLFDICTLDP